MSADAAHREHTLAQAGTYRTAGHAEDALRLVGPLLVQYPGDVEASWVAAMSLCDLSRGEEALRIARQAVTASPQDADAWRLLSVLLTEPTEVAEAIAAGTRAVQLAPLDPYTRAAAGFALSRSPRRRDRKQAIAEAKEMLRLAPGHPGFHVANGQILTRCQRLNDAERAFHEALRLDPGNLAARDGIGAVHDQRGHVLRAYKSWGSVLGERPDDRSLSRDVIYTIGRWARVMVYTGVSFGWVAFAFTFLATDKDPFEASKYTTLAMVLAGLAALFVVGIAVRLVRDRRLARLLWSHHLLRALTGLIGTATYLVAAVLLVLTSPQIASGFALGGALLTSAVATINSVVQRRKDA